MSKVKLAANERLAIALTQLLGVTISPDTIALYGSRGYWAHVNQDCMKFTGTFILNGVPRTIGSWEFTLTDVARGKGRVYDNRSYRRRYSDFEVSSP